MKLSEKLFEETRPLWEEATKKEFVLCMAEGTLDSELFKNYMIQDYLYLIEYIDILKDILSLADDPKLIAHLEMIISETEKETYNVHIPAMESLGVSEDVAKSSKQDPSFAAYLAYMKAGLAEGGLLAGLTGLLQCSWNYAYVAKSVADTYPEKVAASPFKNWFDAYTSTAYVTANQLWIDILDEKTTDIDEEETKKLSTLFKKCAEYENGLWDALIKGASN